MNNLYPTGKKQTGLLYSLALAGSSLLLPGSALSQPDAQVEAAQTEVRQVQRAISRSNGQANWVASTTSMTLLPPEERVMRLGVSIPASVGNRQYAPGSTITYPSAITGGSTPPAAFDWRSVNGHSYVTDIKNQGSCGSCWAFATAAALESKALISMNTPNVNLNLSEQTLVSCSGAGTCNGGQVDRVSDYLQKTGDGAESTFPYTGKDTACSSAQANWQNNAFKLSNWQYVNRWNTSDKLSIDKIKNALYNSGPLPATFNVYKDFYSYKSGIYSATSTAYEGRHAVTIVGYDDNAKALIVKNSWGTGWGENGYFRVAYNQIHGTGAKMEFGQEILAYGSASTPGAVCLYSLSQSSQTAAATASSGAFNISVNATGTSCAWNAASSVNWLSITGGASGSGNGKVSFNIAANTSNQTRTGTIKAGEQTFTVTQAAASSPIPSCSLSSSATTVKAGATVTLTAACTPVVTSYTWTNATIATNSASGKVTVSKTTTYSVKGNNSAGSSTVANVTVAVETPPPPSCKLAASATSVVPGTPVKLTATCTPAATKYNWTNSGLAATAASGNVTPSATTTYSVSGINANGTGTAASATVTVVLPPPPVCSLTASSTNIKKGASVTLTAKCIPAASSYVWTNSGIGTKLATGSVKPATTTTYSVSGVNAAGTGQAARTTVTVADPAPLAPSQLVAPSGQIANSTPAFSWNASAYATNYTLRITTSTSTVMVKMAANSVGCAAGNGTCLVKPAAALPSNIVHNWSVMASNASGSSPYSAVKSFQVVLSKDGKIYPAGNYDAGAIGSNADAQRICPTTCSAKGLKWNGNWTTTVPGKTSVCGCKN